MSFTIRQLRDYLTSHMDLEVIVYEDDTVATDPDTDISLIDLYMEVDAYYEEEA